MDKIAGFRFRLADEIEERREMQSLFNSLCRTGGSTEIELPIIVPLEEFVGAWPRPLSKNHLSRVFHGMIFQGEQASLGAVRYEGTTPLARFVTSLNLDKPVERFHYFQEMVRIEESLDLDEKHQRAFFQLGQEKFCSTHEAHIRELIKSLALGMELIDSIGQRPKLRLSHIDLVKKVLYAPQITPVARRSLYPLLEDGKFQELETVLANAGIDAEVVDQILKMATLRDVPLEQGIEYLRELGLDQAREELELCAKQLSFNRNDFQESVRFDAGIHRSLNFYSGITLQLDAGDVREVAGGGDYSALVSEMSGRELFAGGFAAGFERLALAKKELLHANNH